MTFNHLITSQKIALILLFVLISSNYAYAKLKVSNTVTYFPVRGTSASAIYTNLVVNGPGGQSGSAMATTNATISHTFKLKQGKRCTLNAHKINVAIVTQLPRLISRRKLSSSMRRTWRSFNRYLRRHENRHKAIYIGCARRIEKLSRRLAKSASCNGVRSAISRVRYSELAKCERLHSAYDRREFPRIKRLSLIVRASRKTFNRKPRKNRRLRK